MANTGAVQENGGSTITTESGEVRLVTVSRDELQRTFVNKRREWREAKSVYGSAGQRVNMLKEEPEAIADEMERRDALQDELPFSE